MSGHKEGKTYIVLKWFVMFCFCSIQDSDFSSFACTKKFVVVVFLKVNCSSYISYENSFLPYDKEIKDQGSI